MKSRKDKWTEEETLMLKSIVLEYIHNGDTKTAAFKKASDLIGRTPAACGYRWNTVVCKKDQTTIKTSAQQLLLPPPKEIMPHINLEKVVEYLTRLKDGFPSNDLLQENKNLLAEQYQLKKRLASLEKEYLEKKESYRKLLQQYETFAGILDGAEDLFEEHKKVIH